MGVRAVVWGGLLAGCVVGCGNHPTASPGLLTMVAEGRRTAAGPAGAPALTHGAYNEDTPLDILWGEYADGPAPPAPPEQLRTTYTIAQIELSKDTPGPDAKWEPLLAAPVAVIANPYGTGSPLTLSAKPGSYRGIRITLGDTMVVHFVGYPLGTRHDAQGRPYVYKDIPSGDVTFRGLSKFPPLEIGLLKGDMDIRPHEEKRIRLITWGFGRDVHAQTTTDPVTGIHTRRMWIDPVELWKTSPLLEIAL